MVLESCRTVVCIFNGDGLPIRRIRLANAAGVLGTYEGKRCLLRPDPTPDRMRAIILLILVLPISVFADQYDKILEAIAKVETGGEA